MHVFYMHLFPELCADVSVFVGMSASMAYVCIYRSLCMHDVWVFVWDGACVGGVWV